MRQNNLGLHTYVSIPNLYYSKAVEIPSQETHVKMTRDWKNVQKFYVMIHLELMVHGKLLGEKNLKKKVSLESKNKNMKK